MSDQDQSEPDPFRESRSYDTLCCDSKEIFLVLSVDDDDI